LRKLAKGNLAITAEAKRGSLEFFLPGEQEDQVASLARVRLWNIKVEGGRNGRIDSSIESSTVGGSGFAESIRTIRWGNWNSPERSVGQLVALVEVAVAVVEGRILVERDVTGTLDMWVLLAKPVTLLKGPDAVAVTEALHDGQV